MKINLIQPEDGAITGPLQKHFLSIEDEIKSNTAGSQAPPLDWENLRVFREDRSLPAPSVFRWETDGQPPGKHSYRLYVSEREDFNERTIVRRVSGQSAGVLHLHTAKRYFWRVEAFRLRRLAGKSPVYSFTTPDRPPRWIRAPGMTNLRDIGGWPLPGGKRVRQGLIYRGSEMNNRLSVKRSGRRVLVEELGIRTDLDLRRDDAAPALDRKLVDWVNIPVLPYAHIFRDEQKAAYRRIFEELSDRERHPVIFHCLGGADRAGTLAFLLNALLGAAYEDLLRDYELTSLSIWGPRTRETPEFRELVEGLSEYAPGGGINRQVREYLLSAGAGPGTIEALKELMIE